MANEFTDETWEEFSNNVAKLGSTPGNVIVPEDVSLDQYNLGYIAYVNVSGKLLYSGEYKTSEKLAGESLLQLLTNKKDK